MYFILKSFVVTFLQWFFAVVVSILVLAATAIMLTSCAGLNPVKIPGVYGESTTVVVSGDAVPSVKYTASQTECSNLRKSYRMWGALAVGSAAFSGVGGFSSAMLQDTTPRWVAGGISALTAVISAISIYLRDDVIEEWEAGKCSETEEKSGTCGAVR